MALPEIATRDEWLAARKALLTREKELTRDKDALNADRRRLPMVRVAEDYRFNDGGIPLVDLFDGSRQLVVQHVMYDPEWDDACQSCSASLDEIPPGLLKHLKARETAFAAVARAPLAKIEAYRARRGWTFPWYSSYGNTFNYDYHVTIDASVAPVMFNYRDAAELEDKGAGWLNEGSSEQPGYSCFLADGGDIFHTYSTFGRGCEQASDSYGFLDMTALGRQEVWEEPKGRSDAARPPNPNFQ